MMIWRKMWCLVRCLFGHHFWTLNDKKNTKECFHCEKEAHLAPKLWESFKVHEGETDARQHGQAK